MARRDPAFPVPRHGADNQSLKEHIDAQGCGELPQAGVVNHIFGRTLAFLVRIGLIRGHFYVLEVRGRRTGKTISLPVDPLDLDKRRYLVCSRGNSNWVRNARAAGEVVLAPAIRRHRYTARELPPRERPPVLKAYLDHFASEVQRLLAVLKGSPAEAFRDLAPRYRAEALTRPHRHRSV